MIWTNVVIPSDAPAVRVIAVPHAGGWSTSFRSWAEVIPRHVEVRVAQLPGRERRAGEANASSFDAIVEGVLGDLPRDGLPLVVFGHSFGAFAAYELARGLRVSGEEVQTLVVSGKQPPCFPSLPPFASEASSWELMNRLSDMGGITENLRSRPALLEPFLGAIRADLALMESYARPSAPCDVPILAVHAVRDPVVVGDRLRLWSLETTQRFELMEIDGDHFGIYDPKEFRRVAERLRWGRVNGVASDDRIGY